MNTSTIKGSRDKTMNEKQVTTIYLRPEIIQEMRVEQARRGLHSLGDLLEDLWRSHKSTKQPSAQKPQAAKNAPNPAGTGKDTQKWLQQKRIALIPGILEAPEDYHPREIFRAAEAVEKQDPARAVELMALYDKIVGEKEE